MQTVTKPDVSASSSVLAPQIANQPAKRRKPSSSSRRGSVASFTSESSSFPTPTLNSSTNPISSQDAGTISGQSPSLRALETDVQHLADQLSSLTMLIGSLRNTYESSRSDLTTLSSDHPTRLNNQENELLMAYDDIKNRLTRLEKRLSKTENLFGEIHPPPSVAPSPIIEGMPDMGTDVRSHSLYGTRIDSESQPHHDPNYDAYYVHPISMDPVSSWMSQKPALGDSPSNLSEPDM